MARCDGFDGEFIRVPGREIKIGDVAFASQRHVTGDHAFAPSDVVPVFRPDDPDAADATCGQCDAGPGEPCTWDCMGMAGLSDAADRVWPGLHPDA